MEVKREIGSIWADTDTPPYTQIFPQELSAERVWKAVGIMRAVDELIQVLRFSTAPRADLVGTHMGRIILHLVFQDPDVRLAYKGTGLISDAITTARRSVKPIFDKVASYIEMNHPSDYLANFSKNTVKCEFLVANLDTPEGDPDGYGDLLRWAAME